MVYSGSALAVQDAVDAASEGSTVKVAGYCTGAQPRAGTLQTVYISKTLTLAGGYTTTDWVNSYPLPNRRRWTPLARGAWCMPLWTSPCPT